jgi:hypothetical protein
MGRLLMFIAIIGLMLSLGSCAQSARPTSGYGFKKDARKASVARGCHPVMVKSKQDRYAHSPNRKFAKKIAKRNSGSSSKRTIALITRR